MEKDIDKENEKVLDVSDTLNRLGGDEELMIEVIELFLEEAPELITRVEEAVKNKKWEDAAKLAHSLKGASANVGANMFSALSLQLEFACKSGDFDQARNSYESLARELEEIRQFVAKPAWLAQSLHSHLSEL